MTHAEVLELVSGILDRWPHVEAKMTDKVIEQYRRDLSMVLPEHAAIAVETWYRDGERFAPSGAEIFGRIADLAIDVPDWGTVKSILERRAAAADGRRLWTDGRSCPLGQCDGSGTDEVFAPGNDFRPIASRRCACREQMAAERASRDAVHPVIADFLELVGEREIADVLSGDRTAEAQVRTKYQAHVRSIRRQVLFQGLPDGGLAGMRRLAAEAAERLPKLVPGGGDRDRQPEHIGDAMRAITDRSA